MILPIRNIKHYMQIKNLCPNISLSAKLATGLLIILSFKYSVAPAQSNLVSQSNELVKKFNTTDTLFKHPYVDVKEWRTKPVRHLYVHGGFKNTDTKFSFYFPEKKKYENRFYQYITPIPDNEYISQNQKGEEDKISFSIASGAYFVETNGGGKLKEGESTLITAYLANAASAKYSKVVASEIYGQHRTYGYAFGGSGGAYRTIGGIENTDAWDGAVPYVVGSPVAIPNMFTVRMHAMRILKNKFPQIIDALEPGGSGDMYKGLNEKERGALTEVTKMGFPPQSWFGYETMGVHGFSAVYPGMVSADPSYFNKDFWNKKGYLGFDDPQSLQKFRLQADSRIKALIYEDEAVKMGLIPAPTITERGSADLAWKGNGQDQKLPVAFQLENILPEVDFLGGDLKILDGPHKDKKIQISKTVGDKIIIGAGTYPFAADVKVGNKVQIDNSDFLAAQTYHRHQVPNTIDFPVWKQFVGNDGKPIYPQRDLLVGPLFTRSASGVLPSGKLKGKVIVLSSLWDREALPWNADWYAREVHKQLKDQTDHNFRLWYTDRAVHGDVTKQEDPDRLVSYLGTLQQALRDLSQWVENGIEPSPTTNYRVVDGQVIIPPTAVERKGLQPVPQLLVEDQKAVVKNVGENAKFNVTIDLPENTGKIVRVEWDFENKGTFKKGKFKASQEKNVYNAESKHKFVHKGTYFVTVRIVSQRNGNKKTPFALIQNLDRVRVVVK